MNAALSLARKAIRAPLARDTLVSLTIRIGGMSLYFLQTVLLARALGPAGYGRFAIGLAFAEVGSTFALFGLGTYAIREVAHRVACGESDAVRPFRRFAITTVILFSLFSGAVLFALREATPLPAITVAISIALIPLLALVQLNRGISQGFGSVVAAQMPGEVIKPALTCAGLGFALLVGLTLRPEEGLTLLAAATVLAVLAGTLFLRPAMTKLMHGALNTNAIRNWVGASVPYLAYTAGYAISGALATLMTGWLAKDAQAGLLQPMIRLALLLQLPIVAAQVRVQPLITEYWTRNDPGALRDVTHRFTLATTTATAIAAIGLGLGGPIVLGLYGGQFVTEAPLLWIIGGAYVFTAACGPLVSLMNMTGKAWATSGAYAFSIAAETIADLLLIPRLGVTGAVTGLAIGMVCWNLALVIPTMRRIGFDASLPSAVRSLMREAWFSPR